MKCQRLYLLRHAKSSWKDLALCDYDRPLNKRGKANVVMMAERFAAKGEAVDIIITSGALRAKSTAKVFAQKSGAAVLYDDNIYEASLETLLEIITTHFQSFERIMLVGHNPGLTLLHNYLCKENIDNIPTCAISALQTKDGHIGKNAMEMLFFEYPRKYM
jgi:phosphohistidine phosphatase